MKYGIIGMFIMLLPFNLWAQLTDTGNKVGVGITKPETKLHIKSSIAPSDIFPPSLHNDYYLNKDYDVLYLQRSSNSLIGPSVFLKGTNNGNSYSARLALLSAGGANSNLSFLTSTNNGYKQQEVMRLTYDGNLGIGTTSVDARLKINGENSFDASHIANNQDLILLKSPDPGNGGYFSGITWQIGSRRRASIVATREHDDTDFVGLAFFTQGTDGPGPMYESMRITRSGNLGVGIKNPSEKLHVAGTIRAEEIKVQAQTADFVFEDDYHLKDLSEVEEFINTNKHLPDIPSAKQMEENGVGLAEMNKLLLQKVEELTLYVIELRKENLKNKTEFESKLSEIEKKLTTQN
ncbi:hypothetical protein DF185_22575 [Marinifilum breve]|uniref:Peptidase S74 domain-containing protein n=1 Tax=Marinifilum breve TaxID=2184082 RepID=A0A2V3ZUR5_9BACT|nr:hypothetical protein [Marinifilum breve]PXX95167.1 hypothetical protein DF185_22575 [Marinifilum breve]